MASLYSFSSVDARMLGADGTGGAEGGEGDRSSSAALECSETRVRLDGGGDDESVAIVSSNADGTGEQLRRGRSKFKSRSHTRQFWDYLYSTSGGCSRYRSAVTCNSVIVG